jgi:hypothetical protein
MIPQEHYALLDSLDHDSMIDADGERPAHSDDVRHQDGTHLSVEEQLLLSAITPSEISEFFSIKEAQATAKVDQVEAELDLVEELRELTEDEWRLHPALTLGQVIERLPEPQRGRAIEVVNALPHDG